MLFLDAFYDGKYEIEQYLKELFPGFLQRVRKILEQSF